MTDPAKFIEFQVQIEKVKHLKRTGWLVRRVPNAETVAAHSWRMALMAIRKDLTPARADADHIIKMCLLHDIGEAVIGDIVPEIHQTSARKISDATKKTIEKEAVAHLATKYDFPELETFFDEYEGQTTPEAKVAKNLDKLDMLLQAYEYMTLYPNLEKLDEFMTFNEKSVDLPVFSPDLREIKNRQENKGASPNAFIDNQLSAGKLKHQRHNPTGAHIDDYGTVASHRFGAAVMGLYLADELAQTGTDVMAAVRSIIDPDGSKAGPKERLAADELGLLEDVLQAHAYTKIYPNEKGLKDYIEGAKSRITTPLFKRIVSEL